MIRHFIVAENKSIEGLAAATALFDGRALRVLNLMDDFTREDRSLPAERVIALLERVAQARRLPETIVLDNGPKFASKALHGWAHRHGVTLHFIDPGKPTQNAFTLREECLNAGCSRASRMHAPRASAGAGATTRSARTARSATFRPRSSRGSCVLAAWRPARESRGLRPRSPDRTS